jgi:hypothetical protein
VADEERVVVEVVDEQLQPFLVLGLRGVVNGRQDQPTRDEFSVAISVSR